MLKTILAIIISVTFLGVFFFIIVRNLLKRKLDQLQEDEKKRKLNDLE
jgi:preprotein translocase subunit YajC